MKKIRNLIVIPIYLYQVCISPFLGRNCRFYPTCSNYALEALKEYKLFIALKLIIVRVLRCNPWGGSGVDLLPKKNVKN